MTLSAQAVGIYCFTFLTLVVITVRGLKDVEIIWRSGRGYVRKGRDVHVRCRYDLEQEPLYAVKWYKGPPFKEFYRYLPKEVPPALAFHLPGIVVDMTLSNDHDVVLKNASLDVSGLYKCVVAAEFPFETLSVVSKFEVLEIPEIGDDVPELRLDRSQYHPGDAVFAECQSPPSHPSPNITWYIDDVKIDRGNVKTEFIKTEDNPRVASTVSRISFDLPEKVTPVKIFCRANVYSEYDRVSNTSAIHPIPRTLIGTETLLRSESSCLLNHAPALNAISLLILVICAQFRTNFG